MKRIYTLVAVAATFLGTISCVQEFADKTHYPDGTVVYKAISEGTDSKAVLGTNEAGRPQSMWEKGDKITIHNGAAGYEFTTDAEDGSAVADFTYAGDDFSADNGVVAIYPSGNYDPDFETRRVMITIPAQQLAVPGSYDRTAVPAVAYSKDNTLSFKNAGALLKFTMNQDNVAKVRFYANGSILAGAYNAVFNENGEITYDYIPDIPEYNINYVELSASEGETFVKGSTYYISVMPNGYPGFAIQFMDSAGELIWEKHHYGNVYIQRNKILNLGSLGNDYWNGYADKLYVVGSYNQWKHDPNLYLFDFKGDRMVYDGIVDFNAYGQLTSGQRNEFKFTGGYWGYNEFSQESGDYYETEIDNLPLIQGVGDNINAYQKYRFYHFTLDMSACTLTKNYAFNSLYVFGSFNDWAEGVVMNFNPDTQNFWADLDLSEDAQMYIYFDDEITPTRGMSNDSRSNYGQDNISASAGQYRLYVNMNNLSRMTHTFSAEAYGTEENAGQWDPWADEPQPEPVYGWSLIGEFNSWGADEVMTETEPGKWEYKGFTLEAGQQWKLRKDGSWDENYGGPGYVEPYEITLGEPFEATWYGKNMAVTATGVYDIYFNENNCTILVLEAGSPLPEPSGTDYIDEYGINHGPGVEIDGVVWAPVNCGYHAEDFKYGKLYQWGRKYGQGYEGRLYSMNGSHIGEYSDALVPSVSEASVSVSEGNDPYNANIFYNKWLSNDEGSLLWNKGSESAPVKTEYDPCPEGWRVPTGSELHALSQNFSSTIQNGISGILLSGLSECTGEASKIFFPFGGYSYKTGVALSVSRGETGFYWTSTQRYSDIPVSSPRYVSYYESYVNNDTSSPPAIGFSVRCVKEGSGLTPVEEVIINNPPAPMYVGDTHEFSATVYPYDATVQSIIWHSNNPTVATVDQYGRVKAKAPGTATITAAAGIRSTDCLVTVIGNGGSQSGDIEAMPEIELF